MAGRIPPFLLIAMALVVSCASMGEARGRRFDFSYGVAQPSALQVQPVQYQVDPLSRKMDGAAGYNADYFTDLPQGRDKLFLTLITGDNWQSDQMQSAVAGWFERDPRLVAFRNECHWNWYTHSNPHFSERLRKRVGDVVPQVVLQNPDGSVLLNISTSMPGTAGELADMINASVERKFSPPSFDSGTHIIREASGDCPNCVPPQQPNVAPSEVINEVVPNRPGEAMPVLFGVGIAGAIIAFGVFIALATRRQSGSSVTGSNLL